MKRNPVNLTRSVFLWAMLGIICGLFAASYWIFWSYRMVGFEYFSGLSLLIIMALAGLLIGLLIHWLGNPGEIGLIIDNIHLNGGRLPMNENPSMILSSLISIASGGSAGPEAPMVQVTGSIGTWLAERFQLRGEALRTLSIAGMASGFRVLFGAPLGGTFFALEILYHQNVVEYFKAILPAVVASCASYTIFVAITQLGIDPTWHFPQYNVDSLYDFNAAIAYGIVGAIVGWLFIAVFRSVGRLFDSIPSPIYVRTTLAELGLGVLSAFFPLTRFFGEHQIEKIVEGNFSLGFVLTLVIAKVFAISTTLTLPRRSVGGILSGYFGTG